MVQIDVVGIITSAAMPLIAKASTAVTTVGLAILAMVALVWGMLYVYALVNGESSASVFYKVGRIFGEREFDAQYREWSEVEDRREARREQVERFRERRRRGD